MGSLDSVHARVGLHPLDTVLSLVWRQLPAQLLWQNVRLVRSEDPEGVDDLLGSVHVRRLPGHEVQEAVELDIAGGVRVDDGEDTLEVDLALLVLSDAVAERDQAVLELLWVQPAGPGFVKVVEARAELVQLLLSDALAVPGQDLVLHLVDCPVNGGDQLLPTHSEGLPGVLSVSVLKDKALLDLLVDPLQLLEVGLELVDGLLVLPQSAQLLLQAALHAHADGSDSVHLPLDPGSDLVRLLGELLAVVDEGDDGGELLVRLTQGCLELGMRVDQALDLLQGVDDEHVNQVLAGPVQPVVEGCRTLSKLKMEGVNTLQNLLSLVHSLPALLGQCSKAIPLVTDGLAATIDLSRVPVVKSIQLLSNCSNLLNAVLVGGQVGFECFVLLLHCLQLKDLAVL